MVICLEQDADLHMAQLMPLPLTDSCFSKIQIGFPFLVPAHPGNPAQRAIKRVCVCIGNIESYLGNGDSVDNAGEENSSIFNLIQMHWLPSATCTFLNKYSIKGRLPGVSS